MALHLMEKKEKICKKNVGQIMFGNKKKNRHYVRSGIGFKAELAKIYGRINIVYRNKTR